MSNDPWAAFPLVERPAAQADPWAAFPLVDTRPPAEQVASNMLAAGARGVANFVGLPGDVQRGADRAFEWLGRQFGINLSRPAPPPGHEWMARVRLPTSEDVRGAARDIGVPVDRRAETAPGRIAQDIVEGALSMPLSPATVAYGALGGAAGGAAAEGARAAGVDQTGQDVARIAGSIAAPLVAGRIAASRATERAIEAVPSPDDLRAAAQALYRRADQAGLVVTPRAYDRGLVALRQAGSRTTKAPDLLPQTTAAQAAIEKYRNRPMSLGELDEMRQIIRNHWLDARALDFTRRTGQPSADTAALARMIERFDDWLANLKPRDIAAGNHQAAMEAMRDARTMWGRQARGRVLEYAIDRAATRAGQFTGSGFENALRTEFRQLAMNPKRLIGFSPDEVEAVRAVARGGPLDNFWRAVGRLAPRGVVSGPLQAAAMGSLGGLDTAAATMAAGELGRRMATGRTALNAQLASAIVRSGAQIPRAAISPPAGAVIIGTGGRELFAEPPPPATRR